jgi:hypothetical protein
LTLKLKYSIIEIQRCPAGGTRTATSTGREMGRGTWRKEWEGRREGRRRKGGKGEELRPHCEGLTPIVVVIRNIYNNFWDGYYLIAGPAVWNNLPANGKP